MSALIRFSGWIGHVKRHIWIFEQHGISLNDVFEVQRRGDATRQQEDAKDQEERRRKELYKEDDRSKRRSKEKERRGDGSQSSSRSSSSSKETTAFVTWGRSATLLFFSEVDGAEEGDADADADVEGL